MGDKVIGPIVDVDLLIGSSLGRVIEPIFGKVEEDSAAATVRERITVTLFVYLSSVFQMIRDRFYP